MHSNQYKTICLNLKYLLMEKNRYLANSIGSMELIIISTTTKLSLHSSENIISKCF